LSRQFLRGGITLFLLLLFGGCYNNSHVRSQRVMEEGESILSVGSNIAIGGDYDDESYRIDDHGVSGFRVGLSYLKNIKGTEHGIYLGLGVLDISSSYILGYDYRKLVEKNGRQFRYSLYSEYNTIKSTGGGRWENDISGTAFQFRPAISTVTSEVNKYYIGAHGILGFGTINRSYWDSYYDTQYDRWRDGEFEYSYNSSVVGAGISAGYEQRFLGLIVQSQFDVSLLNRTSNLMDEVINFGDTYGLAPLNASEMHFGVGMAIYVAPKKKRGTTRSSQIIPPQHIVEKIPDSEMVYDPFTGTRVKKEKQGSSLQFDPETGELIEVSESTPQFDPLTGAMVVQNEPVEFDPMTGLPLEVKSPERSPDESLLSVEERTLLATRGLRILALNGRSVNAAVLDLNDRGIVIKYKGTGVVPVETLYYQRIRDIQFGSPTKGIGEAGSMGLAGCASGVGIPLAIALLTDNFEFLGVSIIAAPVAGIGGFLYGLGYRERYDLNFAPYIIRKLPSEEINKRKKHAIVRMTKQYLKSGFPNYNLVQ